MRFRREGLGCWTVLGSYSSYDAVLSTLVEFAILNWPTLII
jgi:hypothetical protein